MQNLINKFKALAILIILIVIAFLLFQNNKSQKVQQQAALFYKMQDDFFFKNENFFQIMETIEDNMPILIANGGGYGEVAIDNYLGFFELLKNYVDDGVLPYDWVNNQFGYYITQAYKDIEIKDYLFRLKKESPLPSYIYNDFEDLAKRIIKEDSVYLIKKKGK